MDTENNVFMLPSRAEEARNVARNLAEQYVSIAYCALPDMGLDEFAHEVYQVLTSDYSAVKVVRVRARDTMVNTVRDLLQGLKEVGVDIDMSDLRRDRPDDFVFMALRALMHGLQHLGKKQKVAVIWRDFDRLDSGSVDELNPDMFNFPEDYHLSTLLLSHLPFDSMWGASRRCPSCFRNPNSIKPYVKLELQDWCERCGICGNDFKMLWAECCGFPNFADIVLSNWRRNRDWTDVRQRIEARSSEYAETLVSLFDKINLPTGRTLGCSFRAWICSGVLPSRYESILLDDYGLSRVLMGSLPRTLVEQIKKSNENLTRSVSGIDGERAHPCLLVNLDHKTVEFKERYKDISTEPLQFIIIVLSLVKPRGCQPKDLQKKITDIVDWLESSGEEYLFLPCKALRNKLNSITNISDCMRKVREKLEGGKIDSLLNGADFKECRIFCSGPNKKEGIESRPANWSDYIVVRWIFNGETYDVFPYEKFPKELRDFFMS